MQINTWLVSGRLGSDPKPIKAQTGMVLSMNLAVTSGFGENAKTEWVQATAFGRLAERLQTASENGLLRKGVEVVCQGRAGTRVYNDVTSLVINLSACDLVLPPKPKDSDDQQPSKPAAKQTQPDFDDDITF